MVGFAVIAILLIAAFSAWFAKVYADHRVRMIVCIIRPEQIGDVTYALKAQGRIMGMTVINVRGFGRQQGDKGENPSVSDEVIRFQPKLKLEILAHHRDVKDIIETIRAALKTGEIGDGKIFVYDAAGAMRIRTGEKGLSAL